jgi:hypothetical protein
MLVALVGSTILAMLLAVAVLSLLTGAIRHSHADQRFELAARLRATRDHRRSAAGTSPPLTGWAARPDAS